MPAIGRALILPGSRHTTMAKRRTEDESRPGRPVIRNPRARHRYEFIENIECGIALEGPEVKSLRAGLGSLEEGYCRIKRNELWLVGVHIAEYDAKGYATVDPVRPRKLLLRRRELVNLRKAVERKGLTLVPLRIYWSERNLAKVEIALAKGKRTHDKRASEKARQASREISRYKRR